MVGELIAWFFIPDRGILKGEDARFRTYLEEKRFDTSLWRESAGADQEYLFQLTIFLRREYQGIF
jgi:hypothetical protein